MTHSYYVGIDGGGSKCKARLENEQGQLIGECVTGPANPARDYDKAIHSIETALDTLFEIANLPIDAQVRTHVVIGLAGLNVPECFTRIQQWPHSFASLKFTTDLHIACVGSHEKASGAIVIIGTGSSGLVCEGSAHYEYGGHGFQLGDKGSGAWYGSQLVRHVLEYIDGVSPSSKLIEAFIERFQNNREQTASAVIHKFLHATPAEFASLAPLLFEFAEKGDAVAIQIVQQGADYISALCTQMNKRQPTRLSFIGGLSQKVIPWLSVDIQSQISPALNSPEVGAVLLAKTNLTLGKLSA